MPLLKLETTVALTAEKQTALLASLSTIVAATIGKPEDYVMVTIHPTAIQMAGEPGNAAFVDIRSIGGLSVETNRRLAEKVCKELGDHAGIPPERVYVNFTEIEAVNWGWKGSTFG